MAVQLHRSALSHARNLIKLAKAVRDERDWWSEHQLSAAKENEFIRRHGETKRRRGDTNSPMATSPKCIAAP